MLLSIMYVILQLTLIPGYVNICHTLSLSPNAYNMKLLSYLSANQPFHSSKFHLTYFQTSVLISIDIFSVLPDTMNIPFHNLYPVIF